MLLSKAQKKTELARKAYRYLKKKRKVNNPLLKRPVTEGARSKKAKKRRGLEEY